MINKKYCFDEIRLRKREELIDTGYEIYPYSYMDSVHIKSLIEKYSDINDKDKNSNISINTSGRIWAIRNMGKTFFMDLRDNTGQIQLYINKGIISKENWDLINYIDIGDIIGAVGVVFRTKMGELSIKVTDLKILAKAVVSIPIGKETEEKIYYRVTDPEVKYRERYIHWLLDRDDRERIILRTKIIALIRKWMEENEFLEVSTPTIEFIYGGAEARPFKTSIWAHSNKEAFLRISPELYLKRYIVAGFDRVYTICQNFRNEGIDLSHNPEFTMMEWYEVYTDYQDQMVRFENLVSYICQQIHGTTVINYQGIELDFTPPWTRLTIIDALKHYTKIDGSKMTVERLKTELKQRNIQFNNPLSWGHAIMLLFESECEKNLIQPTFILDHPVEISPLTKVKRGDHRLVERFEPYVYGMEVGNAYSELTDPVIQLRRLEEQRNDDDYEKHPVDIDFIKAVGCGMPPTGGVGLGVDRIIMLLTNSKSIRDIIPFPMIKPK